jgi:hypothetical protein
MGHRKRSSTAALLILEPPGHFLVSEFWIARRNRVNGHRIASREARYRAAVPDHDDLDYLGIWRLHAAYADAVSRRAWPELEPLFLPDAPVRVDTVTGDPIQAVGGAGIGGFIAGAVERFEFFELVILNVHVLPASRGGERQSRTFTCELRQERESGHWSNAFGVYHDDVRPVDGQWCYARRRYQSLARTGRAEVFPFPSNPFA